MLSLRNGHPARATFQILLLLALGACSAAPYRSEPLDNFDVIRRAVSQERGAFRVRASVPSESEAERIFGIPLYGRDIQPVWLEVTNTGDRRGRIALASIDAEYYAPFEVAYMHKARFSTQGRQDLERNLYAHALPRRVAPGQTVSGFVFTHADTGTKAFNLDVFYAAQIPEFEQFTFFVEVPGFTPDHREIDFRSLYAPAEVREVDVDGLRSVLADIPCCTSNRDGNAAGRPVPVFLIAEGRDLLRALLRAGWNETAYQRDEDYRADAEYLFGRPPDATFRKRRDRSTERAELNLWMAPVLVDGKPLWVSQFKHAIGRRYEIGERLLGVTLDPDTSDGRNYVLQDLWYAQSLRHWAWSESGREVSPATPELDFHGNPWFAVDPYRIVIWISGQPVALAEATPIIWDRPLTEAGGAP